MKSVIDEIRRRKVLPWVVGYSASAWILVEVLTAVGNAWGWNPVVARLATVLLAVGVLATATIAWFHGERGRQIVYGPEALLLIMIAALGIVLSVGVLRSSGFQGTGDETLESPAVDALGATLDSPPQDAAR